MYAPTLRPCRDGASFKEHRDQGLTTLLGDVRVEVRPYYHCSRCHPGYFPGDAALGLTGRRMSVAAEEVVTLGGAVTGLDAAATKVLPKRAGIHFSESTVERTTEAHGERLGQRWEHGETPGAARDGDWDRDARGQRVAYVSVDATGVGRQGPGGAKAAGKMVPVGMVFHPAEFDPKSPRDAQPIEQARSLAGPIDLDTLGAHSRRQAGPVGRDRADQWIGLSEGGHGLDGSFTVDVPRAPLIWDFYHAAEHRDEWAKAWSDDPVTAASPLGAWRHQMKAGGGAAVLGTSEAWDRRGRSPEAREHYRLVTRSIRQDADRMDHPSYQAQGWQIGPGFDGVGVQDGDPPTAPQRWDALGRGGHGFGVSSARPVPK